ncbi:MAG TPA: hypothetical protein VMH88_01080 [Gemmatimonadales bacterium]|nr:hypothetical protein [Gemmatimonadales bacterium]
MRKATTLVGLMLLALGASARAEESAPVPAAPPPPVVIVPVVPVPPPPVVVTPPPAVPIELPLRRLEVGVSFLGMAAGSLTTPSGATTASADALFAYGVSLSVSYRVIAGLTLGIAPQAIFNVGYKQDPGGFGGAPPAATKEYDLMARIAYLVPVAEAVTLYAEVLPGFSQLGQSGGGNASGPVVAFDVGAAMDMTERLFINLGFGYQKGFQSLKVMDTTYDSRVNFVRAQLGVGTRF